MLQFLSEEKCDYDNEANCYVFAPILHSHWFKIDFFCHLEKHCFFNVIYQMFFAYSCWCLIYSPDCPFPLSCLAAPLPGCGAHCQSFAFFQSSAPPLPYATFIRDGPLASPVRQSGLKQSNPLYDKGNS